MSPLIESLFEHLSFLQFFSLMKFLLRPWLPLLPSRCSRCWKIASTYLASGVLWKTRCASKEPHSFTGMSSSTSSFLPLFFLVLFVEALDDPMEDKVCFARARSLTGPFHCPQFQALGAKCSGTVRHSLLASASFSLPYSRSGRQGGSGPPC